MLGLGSRVDGGTGSAHSDQLTGFAVVVLDGHTPSKGEPSDQ